MKRLLIVTFVAFVIISICSTLFACIELHGNDISANSTGDNEVVPSNNTDSTEHTHTFSSAWTRDDNYHWHSAICGHDLVNEKSTHVWEVSYVQQATETNEGVTIYTCSICGATKTLVTEIIVEKPTTAVISFDLNGGHTASLTAPLTVEQLEVSDFFFDVIKDGFNFRGWAYNGTIVFNEEGDLVNQVNLQPTMTFVAMYSSTAKLKINTNIPGAGECSPNGEFTYNTEVDVYASPKQGYVFVGWMYNNALLSNQQRYRYKMWDRDVILTAVFDYANYSLIIQSNNAEKGLVFINPTSMDDAYVEQSEDIFSYNTSVTVSAFTKTDARFLGWYNQENQLISTNAVYTFNMPNHDYNLYAKWNYFTITYNLNGGINDNRNPIWYDIDMPSITLFAPTMDGQLFHSWRQGNKDLTIINTQEGVNVSLDATWSILMHYTGEETDVVIDDWITTIAPNAFKDCTFIKSITIPSSVTSIGLGAFSGCSAMEQLIVPFAEMEYENYLYPFGAFFGADSYSGCVSTHQTLHRIIQTESSSYYGGAKEIVYCLPATLFSVTVTGGNLFSAFTGCTELSSITIGEGVSTIEKSAFSGCSKLEAVSIPNSVTLIDKYAFSQCGDLSEIRIPDSVTTIKGYAFYCCVGLSSIVLPEYLTSIEEHVFHGCAALNTITIPVSITTIAENAFYNCTELKSINYGGSITQWQEISKNNKWNNKMRSFTVYCNDGEVDY